MYSEVYFITLYYTLGSEAWVDGFLKRTEREVIDQVGKHGASKIQIASLILYGLMSIALNVFAMVTEWT